MRNPLFVTLLVLIVGLSPVRVGFAQIQYPPLANAGKNNLVKVAAETQELFVRRGVLYRDDGIQEILDRVGDSSQESTVTIRINCDFARKSPPGNCRSKTSASSEYTDR